MRTVSIPGTLVMAAAVLAACPEAIDSRGYLTPQDAKSLPTAKDAKSSWTPDDGSAVTDPGLDSSTGVDDGTEPFDVGPDAPVADGTGPKDLPSLPDGAGPDTPFDVLADGPADLPVGPDAGPLVEFVGCDAQNPCPHPQAPMCLLPPGSQSGVCVTECSPADSDSCPPWLECVLADPGTSLSVCSKVAGEGEACSVYDGTICTGDLYCLNVAEAGGSICAVLCALGETICADGYVCTATGGSEEYGACLPRPDLPECADGASCASESACVPTGAGNGVCAPTCESIGSMCGDWGTCVILELAGGGFANVCLEYQGIGSPCDAAKGMLCDGEGVCADVGAKDGWNRCIQPCGAVSCPAGTLCQPIGPAYQVDVCVPYQYALEQPLPCTDAYPCDPGGEVCLKPPGESVGVCVSSCDAGCPAGTSCHEGGCVVVADLGEACLEQSAVFCSAPAECIVDPGEQGAGWCAQACTLGGSDCPAKTTCLPTGDGDAHCLETTTFGEACSLDDGIGCEAGLSCLNLSSGSDYGFCTPECDGPGSCPTSPPGTYAECILNQGGTWHCGFMCGAWGSCPGKLTCAASGFCM